MSYTALYRKFRPDTFEDVKGQEHIVTTLKNQIRADRLGHAFLFCGTRGTGKTSVAKILAKAVNCEHPVDGSPCNQCATCKAIQAGTSMNVIEIDAASNNGVDNIREIREEVAYRPPQGKYKVYIIDEVHMLSTGAFNALLKTLEEPPSYVIFILATTEAHKIPVTILSRCQRYDFHRLSIETITERLKELMNIEGIKAEDKALRYIAKSADGAMRDALSLLDQCIAFYLGEEITYERVLSVLGTADNEVFSRLLRRVIAGDVASCIHILEELLISGKELGQFVADFTWYMRNLLLIKTSEHPEEVIDVSAESLEVLKEESQMVSVETLMRYIRVFSQLANQLRNATQKRVLVEVALIKLCRPAMETNLDSLLDRVRCLEEKMEKGIVAVSSESSRSYDPGEENRTGQNMENKPEPAVKLEKAAPEDLQWVKKNWKKITGQTEGMFKQLLNSAVVLYDPDAGSDVLYVELDDMGAHCAEDGSKKEMLENIISGQLGKKVEVKMILKNRSTHKELQPVMVDDILNNDILAEVVEEEEPIDDF